MISVLVSFAYLRREPAVLDRLPATWDLFLDSGAFTNFAAGKTVCSLDDYVSFCKSHGRRFLHRFNLDSIGNPEETAANLAALEARGVDVVPVFQRGASAETLRDLCNRYPLVGIGGIAGKAQRSDTSGYVDSVMRVVREAGGNAHMLGVGVAGIERYRPWSADSTSWMSGRKFGTFALFAGGRWVPVQRRTPRSTARPDVSRALAAYGLRAADVLGDRWSPRSALVSTLQARSWIRYSARCATRVVFAADLPDLDVLVRAYQTESGSSL